MTGAPPEVANGLGFRLETRKGGDVLILHYGRAATMLRGGWFVAGV